MEIKNVRTWTTPKNQASPMEERKSDTEDTEKMDTSVKENIKSKWLLEQK